MKAKDVYAIVNLTVSDDDIDLAYVRRYMQQHADEIFGRTEREVADWIINSYLGTLHTPTAVWVFEG